MDQKLILVFTILFFYQCLTIADNVLWYGVVRDYEAISNQFTPTFFTSNKPSRTSETRMHYTICCMLAVFIHFHFLSIFLQYRSVRALERDGLEGSFAQFG